ncbi:hypothetical protein ROZALSC1DRAFT_29131 [Rozella allomycis CSF55]|uniref:Uncharacterized protein n=1 Tax=Rozella allomycis (strain CSF55) TaxID=988480 RepID=A0A075ATW4_ROZAC|nr:hypothetical protein O9G_000479 [Rozella allomycis CSF55]RKP19256.1 hypothetical protein ROZALSC1DRAFT_29131 [Rozella allomycis CSF55]|eukprot:EPZ33703.1 hypothetical protein O9G_000479 [Rozella allomycis CSF55]
MHCYNIFNATCRLKRFFSIESHKITHSLNALKKKGEVHELYKLANSIKQDELKELIRNKTDFSYSTSLEIIKNYSCINNELIFTFINSHKNEKSLIADIKDIISQKEKIDIRPFIDKYREMKFPIDENIILQMMQLFSRDPDLLEKFFFDVQSEGHKLDVRHYTLLITSLLHNRKYEKFSLYFNEMLSKKILDDFLMERIYAHILKYEAANISIKLYESLTNEKKEDVLGRLRHELAISRTRSLDKLPNKYQKVKFLAKEVQKLKKTMSGAKK